ncbi:hypothetical protein N5C25_03290 [Stenotrophomonas sp. GD03958]|nr:hypothetical protein [Stenotrophomonas sp. GD03958]MDH1192744.1 hypothetical protein [Stenotrophomonas sp. GD03958]CRD63630.1 hypothetical protein BN126350127 [Stenotrophomonas maltophilia]
MVDIAHRVGIKAPASQMYQALATPEGVAAWWAEDAHGDYNVGGTVKLRFTNNGQEIGAMEMQLEQLIPGELVLSGSSWSALPNGSAPTCASR